MKKSVFFIPIMILFIVVSSYRFIQLNKSIFDQDRYIEVKNNEVFNINGIDFKLERSRILNDQDEFGRSILKVFLKLNKNGTIDSNLFKKPFPEYYQSLISLNITNKSRGLVENYCTNLDIYAKDNPRFIEVQKGKRNIGEEEILILTFNLDEQIIEKLKNNEYTAKLVFPLDSNDIKFNFININI